jgi:hypothetical protein
MLLANPLVSLWGEIIMKLVLQRIAIYGTLAAVFLGVLGMVLGHMAAILIPQSPVVPGVVADGTPNPDAETLAMIQTRTPIMMAVWGFVFVTIGELILHGWRSRRPMPPGPTQQDQTETEMMLQELLAKAEADEKAKGDGTGRHRDLGGESMELKVGLPDARKGHRTAGGESQEVNINPDEQPPKTT